MIKFLGKASAEIRVADENEADEFHKEMNDLAEKLNAVLSSWTETKREKKSKGEILDSWVVVKYTLTFSDLKDPTVTVQSIDYNVTGGDSYDVPFDDGTVVSAF